MEDVRLVVHQAEHLALVFLLDGQIAFHREVHKSRGDVAHGSFVVHERAAFAGREFVRRIVLHGDGSALRDRGRASTRDKTSRRTRQIGNKKRPVASQKENH